MKTDYRKTRRDAKVCQSFSLPGYAYSDVSGDKILRVSETERRGLIKVEILGREPGTRLDRVEAIMYLRKPQWNLLQMAYEVNLEVSDAQEDDLPF